MADITLGNVIILQNMLYVRKRHGSYSISHQTTHHSQWQPIGNKHEHIAMLIELKTRDNLAKLLYAIISATMLRIQSSFIIGAYRPIYGAYTSRT